jgi:hypothetical protein
MAGNEFAECTLWIWQRTLSQPERYWRLPALSSDE